MAEKLKKLTKRPSYGTHAFFALKEFFGTLDPWLGLGIAAIGFSLTLGPLFPYAWLAFAGAATLCISVGLVRASFYSSRRFFKRGISQEKIAINEFKDIMSQVDVAQKQFDDFSTTSHINRLLDWVNSHSDSVVKALDQSLADDSPFKNRLLSLKQAGCDQKQLLQEYIRDDVSRSVDISEEQKHCHGKLDKFEDFEKTFSGGLFLTYGFVMTGLALAAPFLLAGMPFAPMVAITAVVVGLSLGLVVGTMTYFTHRRYQKRQKVRKNETQNQYQELQQLNKHNSKKSSMEKNAEKINKHSLPNDPNNKSWERARPIKNSNARKGLFIVGEANKDVEAPIKNEKKVKPEDPLLANAAIN